MAVKGVRNIHKGKAVYTDAFQFGFYQIPKELPNHIESDRFIMSNRKGFMRKLFALREDERGYHCGGYYVFDSIKNAQDFAYWCENEFEVDGLQFLDRPIILEPQSQLWEVVQIEDFQSVEQHQKQVRFQRYYILDDRIDEERLWEELQQKARDANCSSLWLLKSISGKKQMGVVYVKDAEEDSLSLTQFENWKTPSDYWIKDGEVVKAFDQTSWIYMVWHPVEAGDQSASTAQWPLSPPLPSIHTSNE